METTCQQGAKQTDDRSVDILWWAADAWRHEQGEALRSSDLKMYLDNKVTLKMSVVMLNTKYQCQHFLQILWVFFSQHYLHLGQWRPVYIKKDKYNNKDLKVLKCFLDAILNLTLMKSRLWWIDLQFLQWHALYKSVTSRNFYGVSVNWKLLFFSDRRFVS